MKNVIIIGAVGLAAYYVLYSMYQSQLRAAIASCSGGSILTAQVCAVRDAVAKKWAWLPVFYTHD